MIGEVEALEILIAVGGLVFFITLAGFMIKMRTEAGEHRKSVEGALSDILKKMSIRK